MGQSLTPQASAVDRFFKVSRSGSSVKTEVIAGFTTFMTMAYILFLNPIILSGPDRTGTTLAEPAVLTVTALAAGISTLAMGLFANYPFAIAAGLGLNAVVAFQLVGGAGLTWAQAMGVVVAEGLIILLLVLTRFRQAVMDAVPLPLKHSIAVGIGLFIAFIGFIYGGFVTPTLLEGAPPVQLGVGGELQGWPVAVFIFGLLLTYYLFTRGLRGALLVGIIATTVFAVMVNELFLDGQGFQGKATIAPILRVPDPESFSLIGNFSFTFFAALGVFPAILAIFSIMLSDFFDTMGTAIGLGREAGFLDPDGRLPGSDRVLIVDSAAAALGGAFSASSNTTYIESASGIAEGGRTGLTAMVVGVLFLLSVFLSPVAEIVPLQAAAPALVIVGFLMMMGVREIPWNDFEAAVPAFLIMVVMPFTFSITNGIGAGFIGYVFIKVARGKAREVAPMMYLAAAAFVIYFAIFYIRGFLE